MNGMLGSFSWLTPILFLLLLGFMGGCGAPISPPVPRSARAPVPVSWAQVVESVNPSVVSITAWSVREASRLGGGRRDYSEGIHAQVGSGVVLEDGVHILTNEHVVRHATRIRVELPGDGGVLRAARIGSDMRSDIALLRLVPRDSERDRKTLLRLKPIRWGSSSRLRAGDPVAAIGNPYGFSQTVSTGVISALGRVGPIGSLESGQIEATPLVQTDASIHPGSSGGPLLNRRGEMIGLTTLLFSRTGGDAGIAFALPADALKYQVEQLISSGRIRRAWLGITAQDLDPQLAEWWRSPGHGVLVTEVALNGPAGGLLRGGDQVLELDGRPVREMFDLKSRVQISHPGQEIRLGLLRNGEFRRVRVRLGISPEERAFEESERIRVSRELGGRIVRGSAPRRHPDIIEFTGLELMDPPAGWKRSLDFSAARGAVVVGIKPDSPALDAGIMPGDWILELNGQVISRATEAVQIKPRVLPGESTSGEFLVALRRGGPEGEKIYRVLRLD